MTLTMYDSVSPEHIPSNAQVVSGYVNGHWPTYPRLKQMFLHARYLVSIAVNNKAAAEVLDVEGGDATPQEAPEWVTWMRDDGLVEPSVYCNKSTWPLVQSEFNRQKVAMPEYWIADPHNPVPASWAIPADWYAIGVRAIQYGWTEGYDISVVSENWKILQRGVTELSMWGADGASQVQQIIDGRTARCREWLLQYQGPNEPSLQKIENAVTFWSQHGGDLTLAGIKDGSL